jgi:hypothetical protein
VYYLIIEHELRNLTMNTHPRFLSELAAKYSAYISTKHFNELLSEIDANDPYPLATLESWLKDIKNDAEIDALAYDDFCDMAY